MVTPTELIGRKFKRDSKYGLSTFTATIADVGWRYYIQPVNQEFSELKIYFSVVSENGISYNINEILILD